MSSRSGRAGFLWLLGVQRSLLVNFVGAREGVCVRAGAQRREAALIYTQPLRSRNVQCAPTILVSLDGTDEEVFVKVCVWREALSSCFQEGGRPYPTVGNAW